jgi:hypothetical protein
MQELNQQPGFNLRRRPIIHFQRMGNPLTGLLELHNHFRQTQLQHEPRCNLLSFQRVTVVLPAETEMLIASLVLDIAACNSC